MKALTHNDIATAIYLASKDKSAKEQAALLPEMVQFLVRHRYLSKAKDVLAALGNIVNRETGTVLARVYSAKVLDSKTKKELEETLRYRYRTAEVILEEKINEKLLGGVRIEVNDEVIDLTLKNRVKKLQEYLIKD